MNGKFIRDWHKLGVKMDHTIKDIATEESVEFKFDSISAPV